MFEINKRFSICYGHRVWTQDLKEEFCAIGDTECKCTAQHGHQGEIQLFMSASDVNHQGFVTDFKHTGWLKDHLDNYFDHKMILDINDPAFQFMTSGTIELSSVQEYHINGVSTSFNKPIAFVLNTQHPDGEVHAVIPLKAVKIEGMIAGYVLDLDNINQYGVWFPYMEQVLRGLFLVDFVPTSENLCKHIYDIATVKMAKLGVKVSKVMWQETPKSQAVYKAK